MLQWPTLRDITLFVGGLAGVFHETVVSNVERPTLLILFAAMLGLPAFLRQDAKQAPPSLPPSPPQAQAPSPPTLPQSVEETRVEGA